MAKAIGGPPDSPDRVPTQSGSGTLTWRIVGTPGFMSPEQARGAPVDPRTDIWAFGCLLFELLTGKPAFKRQTVSETIAAVLGQEPDWQAIPSEVPGRIHNLIRGCLEKDPNRRVGSMAEVLAVVGQEQLRSRRRWLSLVRRPRYVVPILTVLAVLCLAGVRWYQNYSRVRWAKEYAIPEIARLVDSGESKAAFRMLRRAEAILPGDATLMRIRRDNAFETPITTSPPGAEVWATGYDPNDEDWLRLGTTPLATRELPWGFYRLRLEKPGFRTVLGTGEVRGGTSLHFELDKNGHIPDEMVRVPGGNVSTPGFPDAKLESYLIDRLETTNRQFQEFVDQGGYRKREYWKVDFIRNGHAVPWEEAMGMFVDSTGQPGPSTWQAGRFPPGREDFPVSGVSWYEAAAYAEFAGKQLPTVYHWQQAAAPGFYADITDVSNFGGAGPARAGSHKGIGAFGTLDMAGNVREWCWNESAGRRLVRGGAWSDFASMFSDVDAIDTWDRSPQNGIRCVRYDTVAEAGLQAAVRGFARNFREAEPVSESLFRHFRSLYAYDSHDLEARSEPDQDTPDWKREKVTFSAADENERITAYVYIPKRIKPPYQAILYGNPGMAFRLASPQPAEERFFDFLVKSGRAFLLPVLKGQYQRRYLTPARGPNALRDRLILESKEFRRTIEYLASRSDIDRERLGVYGLSRAAYMMPILAVGEERLKAAVLVSVGLPVFSQPLPESDVFHFVTRFRVPTLMINGRSDFIFPLETSQVPMFRLLGAPASDKRLFLADGGHAWTNFQPAIQEALQWFDRYLGPVK